MAQRYLVDPPEQAPCAECEKPVRRATPIERAAFRLSFIHVDLTATEQNELVMEMGSDSPEGHYAWPKGCGPHGGRFEWDCVPCGEAAANG